MTWIITLYLFFHTKSKASSWKSYYLILNQQQQEQSLSHLINPILGFRFISAYLSPWFHVFGSSFPKFFLCPKHPNSISSLLFDFLMQNWNYRGNQVNGGMVSIFDGVSRYCTWVFYFKDYNKIQISCKKGSLSIFGG